jgi:hypothetical protein
VTREEARQEIGATADGLLRGALSYIEGARKIATLPLTADLENDPDIRPFISIDF